MFDKVKKRLRDAVVELVRRVLATDDGRQSAAAALAGLLAWKPPVPCEHVRPAAELYPDLRAEPEPTGAAAGANVVFVTARFRSGSTLLWNLLRQIASVTAYYEPLNERRWFDAAHRGDQVDPTHSGVADYWREYDGLEAAGRFYNERWIDRRMYMDADAWDPDLQRYFELLIERSGGPCVLQSNRIDFRLAWIRRHFPAAKIVHLVRHPRDQWCSCLPKDRSVPRDLNVQEFESLDGFYLLSWARDLKYHFPFLDARRVTHPYQISYYLWKLSYWFGAAQADFTLTFESLVERPRQTLTELLTRLPLEQVDLGPLIQQVENRRLGQWRDYADEDWFRGHEAQCERVLREFVGATPAARPVYSPVAL